MQRQGGVHSIPMRREEMAGENLRDGVVKVALEQRTERLMPSRLRRIPTLQGDGIGRTCTEECRNYFLKLGGTTDVKFALSIMPGAFLYAVKSKRRL